MIRKVLVVMLAAFATMTCYAQMGEKVTFGIRAGAALGGFTSSDDYTLLDLSSKYTINKSDKLSYVAGVMVDVPVAKSLNLSVQSGIWLTEKHTYWDAQRSDYTDSNKYGQKGGYWTLSRKEYDIKAMYLQIPVLATYHYDFWQLRVEANVGAYAEYRIGNGKSTYKTGTWRRGSLNGQSVNTTYNPDVYDGDAFVDDCSNFGFGLQFGAGIYWHHIYIGGTYQMGLSDYLSGIESEATLKASQLSVIMGYQF